jgi:peroxiredoxin
MMRLTFITVVCAGAVASAEDLTRLRLPELTLSATDGAAYELRTLPARGGLTVLTFFSAHCPCQRLHDPRLVELAGAYQGKGVRFLSVDSEYGSSLEADRREAKQRGYPFPVLRDEGGRLAKLLDVHYATATVIIDSQGHVRYRGGVDTDRRGLHDDAKQYLKNAIDALLSGREPQPREPKTLGCYLLGT